MYAETIIVGGGPAGLACAAMLGKLGRTSLVFEKGKEPAASWRRHYDRLHLHSHKMHSGLPGQPMPRNYPKYPSRHQVLNYLEKYASANRIDMRCGERAETIRKQDLWKIETAEKTYEAKNVVVATGLAHIPRSPRYEGREVFSGKIIHSSEFKNAKALDAKRVLVVGFGNSAGEIALECAEAGLGTGLSVRSPVNVIPREMFGLPTMSIAIFQQYFPYRLIDAMNAPFLHMRFGDIGKFGLQWSKHGPLTTVIENGQTPLIDIGTMEKIKSGDIEVFPEISCFREKDVRFKDGRYEPFGAVVLATGYRAALDRLLPDCEERFGALDRPPKGELNPGRDGLYFCGFNVVPTGHLRQIGKEARAIAAMIDR